MALVEMNKQRFRGHQITLKLGGKRVGCYCCTVSVLFQPLCARDSRHLVASSTQFYEGYPLMSQHEGYPQVSQQFSYQCALVPIMPVYDMTTSYQVCFSVVAKVRLGSAADS